MSNKEKNKIEVEDTREKAKIQLIIFLIFFVIAVVFVRVTATFSDENNTNTENDNTIDNPPVLENDTNIESLELKNYHYELRVIIDEEEFVYTGDINNNEETINTNDNEIINNYYYNGRNYYKYIDNNYLLVDSSEIYNDINMDYININNILRYLDESVKEDNTYIVAIEDIMLNSNSSDTIVITINDEENLTIEIDYTNLEKITNPNITNYKVIYELSNIGNIGELREEENEET